MTAEHGTSPGTATGDATRPVALDPAAGRLPSTVVLSWSQRWLSGLRGWLLGAVASVCLSLVGMVLALRLWRADLSVPFASGGDGAVYLMFVRNMQLTGWPHTSPLLDAPLGQDLRNLPNFVGDLWNVAGLKLLSLVLQPAATIDVAYLLGFVLVTLGAYTGLRMLGVSLGATIPLAAAYSWLPYHFIRGEGHLFLSMYAAIPLACVAAVAFLRGGEGVHLPESRRARVLLGLSCAVLLGGTGIYYAAFSLVLVAAAALIRAVDMRRWRPLGLAAVGGAVTVVIALVPAVPSILYTLQGGVSAVEGRSYAASEYYGLKLTDLLLPVLSHRIPAFAALRSATLDSYIPGEGTETLGVVGVVGLVVIAVAALLPTRGYSLRRSLHPLGVLAIVAIVTSTVAGLNSILAIVGFGDLRAWNRMSVVIAFLAMTGFGLAVDSLWRRGSRRPRRNWVRGVAALTAMALLSVVALLDQASNAFVPNYSNNATVWNADEEFFTRVEDELGTGAAVFQLPVVPFPENPPVVLMPDYDHLRGYAHSNLAWSYAGLKGGQAEWQRVALADGLAAALPKLVAVGFDAVYVNRNGYADQGEQVEKVLSEVAGAPLVSQDGTLAVYDLRDWATTLDPNELPDPSSVLEPVYLMLSSGAYPAETSGDDSWQWTTSLAQGSLVNSRPDSVDAELTASLRTSGASTVTVTVGDDTVTLQLPDGSVELSMPLKLAPGTTPLTITTDAAPTSTPGDARDLRLQLVDSEVTVLD